MKWRPALEPLLAYLFDSNIFIKAKNLYYGFDFCPAFWEWLDAGNQRGSVFSIEKVRDELIGGGDELADWAQQRDHEFCLPPDNEVIPSLAAVSNWASSGSSDSGAVSQFLQVADYYLMAHAHAHGLVVVTRLKEISPLPCLALPCLGARSRGPCALRRVPRSPNVPSARQHQRSRRRGGESE
jgi:hypothetical protein